jgi:hypothetical protein
VQAEDHPRPAQVWANVYTQPGLTPAVPDPIKQNLRNQGENFLKAWVKDQMLGMLHRSGVMDELESQDGPLALNILETKTAAPWRMALRIYPETNWSSWLAGKKSLPLTAQYMTELRIDQHWRLISKIDSKMESVNSQIGSEWLNPLGFSTGMHYHFAGTAEQISGLDFRLGYMLSAWKFQVNSFIEPNNQHRYFLTLGRVF